jgi:hypothetical protein
VAWAYNPSTWEGETGGSWLEVSLCKQFTDPSTDITRRKWTGGLEESSFPASNEPWIKFSLHTMFDHISVGKQVTWHAFANKSYINWALSWVREWSSFMLLKGSMIGDVFPSLLQYIDFHSTVISYTHFLVMEMRKYIPIYVGSVRLVTNCIITFVWWWIQ